jgi:hypothetical protein
LARQISNAIGNSLHHMNLPLLDDAVFFELRDILPGIA